MGSADGKRRKSRGQHLLRQCGSLRAHYHVRCICRELAHSAIRQRPTDAGPLLGVKRSQSDGLSGIVISTARDPNSEVECASQQSRFATRLLRDLDHERQIAVQQARLQPAAVMLPADQQGGDASPKLLSHPPEHRKTIGVRAPSCRAKCLYLAARPADCIFDYSPANAFWAQHG